MKQLKCKNCGATIEHLYNHKCPYCRTFIDFNVSKTEDINPRYFYDMEVEGFEREFGTRKMIMIFKGKYLKSSEALEFTEKNVLMKVDYECMIPKDIRFSIAFDMDEFYAITQGDMYKAIDILLSRLPFEIDANKLVEALIKYKEYKPISL